MTSPQPVGHKVIGMEVPGGRLAIETFKSVNEPVLAIYGGGPSLMSSRTSMTVQTTSPVIVFAA